MLTRWMDGPRARAAAALALAAWLLPGCGDDGAQPPSPTEADLLRARATALSTEDKLIQALRALQPLVERPDAASEDLLRAAVLALATSDHAGAAVLARRVEEREADDPSANYLLGCVAEVNLEFEEAVARFRRVLDVDPTDLAARYKLGVVLGYLGREAEAVAAFETVRAAGVAADGGLHVAATNQLGGLLIASGRIDEGLALREHVETLKQQGHVAPSAGDLQRRGYGRLLPPEPRPIPPGALLAPRWPAFTAGAPIALPGASRLAVRDLDLDGRPDLIGWGAGGLHVAHGDGGGAWQVERLLEGAVDDVAIGDLDLSMPPSDQLDGEPAEITWHPAPELLALQGDALRLFTLDVGSRRWASLGPESLRVDGARAAILSDFDHDGHVDVVVAGERGLHVLDNHGTARTTGLTLPDATPQAFADAGVCRAVISEDFDGDNDVDYLLLGERGLMLYSNLRERRFSDLTASADLSAVGAGLTRDDLEVLDVDGDGRPDLLVTSGGGWSWARNETSGTPPRVRFGAPQPLPGPGAPALFVDLDLDGYVDAVSSGPAGAQAARLVPGGGGSAELRGTEAAGAPSVPARLAAADLDGDGAVDLLALRDGAVTPLGGTRSGRGLQLRLRGMRVATEGEGSIVELRTGPIYRRIYWRGDGPPLGLGEHATAQITGITWPNGVVQYALDAPSEQPLRVEENLIQPGSCPFLYTWNGTRWEFVTDVLGTTPLGLPLAPGRFVPFDHEEYVKIEGAQLVPDGGLLKLALTEELREVTYLDRVRLHAIDHPAGVEIQPHEGFVFPPFPPHHVHTFADARPPARALASDGSDVTELLAAVDGRTARPFRSQPFIYKGLAEPWWIELDFGADDATRAAIAAAPRLRLALTGWFQWSDASVNVAASRNPTVSFEPPVIWLPDGEGWRPAGPPIGFPAGKTKTLVVDVTELLVRDDPRLRLPTTLQLSWDAIRLVIDADDAPFVDTPLEALTAQLSFRGFSALVDAGDTTRPERFDWHRLDKPRWNQHPGRYTRYGPVEPLLSAVDDMYAIFGAGDVVHLTFDAGALPPLPDGWSRDWLLYLDGWAKDRDLNTAAAERVEPLPFHAMSAYPPPEAFPWTDERRAWDATYNTRPGAVLLPQLWRTETALAPETWPGWPAHCELPR